MNELLSSYLPIVIFVGVALVIGLALLVAPFLVAYSAPDAEKLSAYECGFNAFDDARMSSMFASISFRSCSSSSTSKWLSCSRGQSLSER
jgi:NADH:ubiquinone oxidoreductase subunit 3 (subunit A)